MGAGHFETRPEAHAYLAALGQAPDETIDLFEAALALSCLQREQLALEKYRHHRKKLADDLHEALLMVEAEGLSGKVQALAAVFTGRHGYIGDDVRYNDVQNADLARVIDRRVGLPITLSILCVTMGTDCGLDVVGVNFPAHYIVRVSEGSQRAFVDPFQGCLVLGAPDLRQILKKAIGPQAELSARYYEPATRRDTLIRLQNNIKLRLIEAEDYEGALTTVETMRLIAPNEYRLDLDAGVLLARLDQTRGAIEALERYMAQVSAPAEKQEVAIMLQQLRGRLN